MLTRWGPLKGAPDPPPVVEVPLAARDADNAYCKQRSRILASETSPKITALLGLPNPLLGSICPDQAHVRRSIYLPYTFTLRTVVYTNRYSPILTTVTRIKVKCTRNSLIWVTRARNQSAKVEESEK